MDGREQRDFPDELGALGTLGLLVGIAFRFTNLVLVVIMSENLKKPSMRMKPEDQKSKMGKIKSSRYAKNSSPSFAGSPSYSAFLKPEQELHERTHDFRERLKQLRENQFHGLEDKDAPGCHTPVGGGLFAGADACPQTGASETYRENDCKNRDGYFEGFERFTDGI
ncbi:hypothetical protein L1987_78784 [Smallanthus sonchifolius]|uniref:Uncharacterized protein n=1 Tax=Smallanthus sonchifolius TaxID=185202 RepID=A0ACB8ZEN8_9ASTR|nr:hypothetical protein L1987_78784 [Smallanthus sonchifolius]